MKKLLGFFLCVMLLAFGVQAHALTITPSTEPVLSGYDTSQNDINTIISEAIDSGEIDPCVALYDQEVNGPEIGILAGSYDTVFDNTPGDPSDATITHTDGSPIVDSPAYLLVKDGEQDPLKEEPPSWYLFDLTAMGWDGMETLVLTGFWPYQGAISHVTLYGNQQSVPEPATMLLLGFGLIGLAGFGRKRFIKKR